MAFDNHSDYEVVENALDIVNYLIQNKELYWKLRDVSHWAAMHNHMEIGGIDFERVYFRRYSLIFRKYGFRNFLDGRTNKVKLEKMKHMLEYVLEEIKNENKLFDSCIQVDIAAK